EVDEGDAVAGARLLFEPARSEGLLAAQIDDRFDATAREPADMMRRRLRRAPDVIRDAMPIIISYSSNSVIDEQHFGVA
ncbi:MAG: hypothetical protein J0H37_02400, partial [Hyphomicrobium denitrificans]|nr:hypothetical protein [Hyphomicrobium denitrificans]